MAHINYLYNTINISYELETLEEIEINIDIKGFILNYNLENYIITLHQWYPIKTIKVEDKIVDNVIQSSWNELVVIKDTFENLQCKIIKNIKNVLPNKDQILFCNDDILTVIDYQHRNINNLHIYPRILYIKAICNKIQCPGTPVFQKNGKLIGVISNIINDFAYIIPTYYIIKTLQKESNDKIYMIYDKNITKINNFNVKNNYVYHKQMSIKIPLDMYFVLEGDKHNTICINKSEEYNYSEMENIMISNERYLVKEGDNYVVNATLLITLKVINKCIFCDFFDFIQLIDANKFLLNVVQCDILNDVNDLSDNEIKRQITIKDVTYVFTMYV